MITGIHAHLVGWVDGIAIEDAGHIYNQFGVNLMIADVIEFMQAFPSDSRFIIIAKENA